MWYTCVFIQIESESFAMELKNLQEIFNERIFRIPDYQRGYSWEENQLRDLWRDIDILEDGKNHYTGMLSTVYKEGKSFVVDGQQRITSLIILIRVILYCEKVKQEEWINGKEKTDYVKKYLHIRRGQRGEIQEPIFGYDKDNPSHVHFQRKILELEIIDGGDAKDTLYTRNLDRAKAYFTKKIKPLSFEQIEIILKKITEHLNFNYYLIDNELNEFVAFETMNNRGKPLSDLELLKNRLIYLSTLFNEHDDKEGHDNKEKEVLRKEINDAWKTVYEYLGKNPKKSLSDDGFLRDHWIMNFSYNRDESKAYKDSLLNKKFTAEKVRSKELKYSDIREYAQDISESVKSYYYMHNPSDSHYSEDVKKWLFKLNRLGFGAFRPLITSILTRKMDEDKIVEILKKAEQFVFIAFNIQFRRSNYKDSVIYRMAYDFHVDGIDFDSECLEIVYDFYAKKFDDKIHEENTTEFFYGWKGLKYFLYEYELYLQNQERGESKIYWEDINAETIEHVFPQNPNEGWDHFDDNSELLHDLGNLLLLSVKRNSEIGNGSFANKCEVFRKGSYSAIDVSQYNDWTPDVVKDRKEKMLQFLTERWGLNRIDNETANSSDDDLTSKKGGKQKYFWEDKDGNVVGGLCLLSKSYFAVDVVDGKIGKLPFKTNPDKKNSPHGYRAAHWVNHIIKKETKAHNEKCKKELGRIAKNITLEERMAKALYWIESEREVDKIDYKNTKTIGDKNGKNKGLLGAVGYKTEKEMIDYLTSQGIEVVS